MSFTARVGDHSRLTIPRDIVEEHGLKEGDYVKVTVQKLRLVEARTSRGESAKLRI